MTKGTSNWLQSRNFATSRRRALESQSRLFERWSTCKCWNTKTSWDCGKSFILGRASPKATKWWGLCTWFSTSWTTTCRAWWTTHPSNLSCRTSSASFTKFWVAWTTCIPRKSFTETSRELIFWSLTEALFKLLTLDWPEICFLSIKNSTTPKKWLLSGSELQNCSMARETTHLL